MKRFKNWLRSVVIVAPISLGLVAFVTQANAGSEGYYKGKAIRVMVPSSAGGGSDAGARIIAKFLPRYLSGNPDSYVQNIPGAGGILGSNYFARKGKPNGLDIFFSGSSTLTQFNRGGKRIRYNPREFIYVGSINRGGSILVVHKDAHKRLKDLKAPPVVVGDPDGSRTWLTLPLWGAEYLGWNVRFVVGYSNSADMILALRQGEIGMMATANAVRINELVKEGLVDIVAQTGLGRRKDFPKVPEFLELLGDKRPAGIPWKGFKIWARPSDIDKLIALPKGTPDQYVRATREAFLKVVKDPEARTALIRFYGNAWDFRGAQETEKMARDITEVSDEVKQYLRDLRAKYGLPRS
ncbi:MAG: hypothetical protein GTO40_09815 [Deltaproteobacteria bacterium]|nr:hypothetical protein [Deltaproteobacteria bacterium]